jgi:hypothetical protein
MTQLANCIASTLSLWPNNPLRFSLGSCPYILQLPGHIQLASNLVLASTSTTRFAVEEADFSLSELSKTVYMGVGTVLDLLLGCEVCTVSEQQRPEHAHTIHFIFFSIH